MSFRVSVWLERVYKGSCSPMTILMKPRLTHSCIRINCIEVDIIHLSYWMFVRGCIDNTTIIQSSLCACVIYSTIYSKIFRINSRRRDIRRKEIIVSQINKFNKVPVISSHINSLWASSISLNWLNRIIYCICS